MGLQSPRDMKGPGMEGEEGSNSTCLELGLERRRKKEGMSR
jgi:hypothetical protein